MCLRIAEGTPPLRSPTKKDGAHNVFDGVIVHALVEEEHDRRFENVIGLLSSLGMTLKCGKCQLKMSEFGFISRTLSARRIGTPDVKVKTVDDVREPKNAAKVRSIIGLVNITEYFFSDNNICTSPTTYHL